MSKNITKASISLLINEIGYFISSMAFIEKRTLKNSQKIFNVFLFILIFSLNLLVSYSQTVYQPNYFTPNQPTNNYLLNSTAFRQEIARFEINVVREGKAPLPITEVPRLEKDDVLKVRLLEEQVNGMKPDQGNWNWTLSVAFINPARNNEKESSVSEEIQFRKTGWYKEYSFIVPYDCQPIFFFYSKPNYRNKILNLISKNQEDIRKIGEKTLELSGAYAKIGSFLNELQFIINGGSYGLSGGYGNIYGNGYGNQYGSNYGYGYGGYYGGYNSYNAYGTTGSFNINLFMQQAVERLARSFNIQLPQCWQYGSYGYGSYSGYSGYGTPNNYLGISQDFIGRAQCVARSVRLEDFDVSVSRMLQQGGMMAVAQLTQKYPQLAFWINVAAAALDFILKLTKKSPLRIVPTVTSTSDNPMQSFGYQNSFSPTVNAQNPITGSNSVKISLYAESPPSDSGFVTAYPLVVNKWQAVPDPEVISLPTPVLMDQCLHAGQNILKSTDLMNDWMADNFTKDFQLIVSSPNGFRKEFPLKKNVGLGGWELNLTKEDLNSFPKISMTLESAVTGRRGFNEVRSPKFDLPIPVGNNWAVKEESQKDFSVGGKRVVTVKNLLGSCKCLQAIIYKPSFGGQFVFEANSRENALVYSIDGREVSFEIDTTGFQSGTGQLELKQNGGESASLNITLYPAPPQISDVRIAKGDSSAFIYGSSLDQIKAVFINGRRAVPENSDQQTPNPAFNQNITVENKSVNTVVKDERDFVFENASEKMLSNTVQIEIELEGGRIYRVTKTFKASLSRPVIVANDLKEVEAVAQVEKTSSISDKLTTQNPLSSLPVFPINTSEVSVIVQNALTDYDFKIENIEIETRIENSQINSAVLPKPDYEVLNHKNLRISFPLNEQAQRLLAGRRLQFRINDKERGSSDWYSIQNTFVRIPDSLSVKCTNEMNGECELSGEGVEYISQVSVDGGQTWYPKQPATLIFQPSSDNRKIAMIPFYSNKKLLQIKLGDFPAGSGFIINNYSFLNLSRRKK